MQRSVIITCDTESLVFPPNASAVEANIFGSYDSESCLRCGIPLIMDCADCIGAKVIFFYDVFTEYSCPGINERVANEILSRGHMLQLHAHIEHLHGAWWNSRGFKRPTWATNYYDRATTEMVYDDALRLYRKAAGTIPQAFRAGAWRYSANILRYMRKCGVDYSFNYYPMTAIRQRFPHGPDAGQLSVFRWSNGLMEVPVATLTIPNPFSDQQKYVGFESHLFRGFNQYKKFVETFALQMPAAAYMVLVMHSWSFSEVSDNQALRIERDKLNAFQEFLEWGGTELSLRFTGAEIFEELASRATDMCVPIEFAGFSNSPLVPIAAAT